MEKNKEVILIIKKIQKRFLYLKSSTEYEKINQDHIISYKLNNKTIYFDISKLKKEKLEKLPDIVQNNILLNFTGLVKQQIKSWETKQLYGDKNPYVKAKVVKKKFSPLAKIFNNIRNEYSKITNFLEEERNQAKYQFHENITGIKEKFLSVLHLPELKEISYDKKYFTEQLKSDKWNLIDELDEQITNAKKCTDDIRNEVNLDKRKR